MPKYINEKTGILQTDLYKEKLAARGLTKVKLTRTINFNGIRDFDIYVKDEVVWSYGTTLHKLSVKYYSDAKYFWIIGLVNNKPTDAHFTIGDSVIIPENPEALNLEIGEKDVRF